MSANLSSMLNTNAGSTWVVQNLTFFPFIQVSCFAAIDTDTDIGVVRIRTV